MKLSLLMTYSVDSIMIGYLLDCFVSSCTSCASWAEMMATLVLRVICHPIKTSFDPVKLLIKLNQMHYFYNFDGSFACANT